MKRRYAYLQPFSHQMGAACLIPTTSYVVQAFASKFVIYDIERPTEILKESILPVKGLLKQFTLLQDLEAGGVSCFSEQYYYFITPQLEIISKRRSLCRQAERLCFGVYKKQEVEAIAKRHSMTEIFPHIFRLGSQLLIPFSGEKRSVFSLLEQCRQITKPEKIKSAFETLCAAGFSSFFLPQSYDPYLQNLYQDEKCTTAILSLLADTAHWIRSLFFLSDGSSLQFLPKLPPECVYGKAYGFQSEWGSLDFEWSKKQLFSVQFHPTKSGLVTIHLPADLQRYRVRRRQKQYQARKGELLEVEAGELLVLDRFEK